MRRKLGTFTVDTLGRIRFNPGFREASTKATVREAFWSPGRYRATRLEGPPGVVEFCRLPCEVHG